MKLCKKCNTTKPETDFYPYFKSKDGFAYDCKSCCSARSVAYQKQVRQKRGYKRIRIAQPKDGFTHICTKCREQKPISDFARNGDRPRSMCRVCDSERQRNFRESNPLKKRQYRLAQSYNITIEQFEELLAKQGGVGPVCGKPDPTGNGWSVDHDHACCPGFGSCGKCVRGILCMNCNNGLGCFRDNPDLLLKGAEYLERTRTISVQEEPCLV